MNEIEHSQRGNAQQRGAVRDGENGGHMLWTRLHFPIRLLPVYTVFADFLLREFVKAGRMTYRWCEDPS